MIIATWDVPPRASEPGYGEFRQAFERFLQARQVSIAKKSTKDAQAFDNRPRAAFERKKLALTANPELGQKGKLMDFQVRNRSLTLIIVVILLESSSE